MPDVQCNPLAVESRRRHLESDGRRLSGWETGENLVHVFGGDGNAIQGPRGLQGCGIQFDAFNAAVGIAQGKVGQGVAEEHGTESAPEGLRPVNGHRLPL